MTNTIAHRLFITCATVSDLFCQASLRFRLLADSWPTDGMSALSRNPTCSRHRVRPRGVSTLRRTLRSGRDLVRSRRSRSRRALRSARQAWPTYVAAIRELPKRLAHAFQDLHNLCVATMRVTLDHDIAWKCKRRGVLRGVQDFAELVMTERGVWHGRITIIPAEIKSGRHAHGSGETHSHEQIRLCWRLNFILSTACDDRRATGTPNSGGWVPRIEDRHRTV